MAYSMNDYWEAIDERESYDMGSNAWTLGQMKVRSIMSAMVSCGNRGMINQVMDEVYSLNDCGAEFDDESVQWMLWLLESNGYTDEAEELKGIAWK